MNRRHFLRSGTAAAAGFLGLRTYLSASPQMASRVISPYGPLIPDPAGLLDLPRGFTYQVISPLGETMDDGLKVPGAPDGMAAFEGPDGTVVLVRNHELNPNQQHLSPFKTDKLPPQFDREMSYDPGEESDQPHIGGTTNVVYNPKTKKVEKHFLSLTGTDRNCAGGAMPWGSWITCEEPQDMESPRGQNHGYCFEVRASADGKLQKPVPLKALGRFRHEAVALDPETGILYLTEDMGDGLLYRFIPNQPGDLTQGTLQALRLVKNDSADLRSYPGSEKIPEGSTFEADWIDLTEIESPKDDLRHRGHQAGAAKFARGEGIQYSDGSLFICCTDGGPEKQGQVYQLTPSREKGKHDQLTLFLQPEKEDLLTNGDNLCAAPWGDLILCEDLIAEHARNTPHVRGVTPDGKVYTIARNAAGRSEFAGSCFSPDGQVLFVNQQGAGKTFAIHGPWDQRQGA